jgi:hypothetical protein
MMLLSKGAEHPLTPSFSDRTYNDSRPSKIPPSVLEITINIRRYQGMSSQRNSLLISNRSKVQSHKGHTFSIISSSNTSNSSAPHTRGTSASAVNTLRNMIIVIVVVKATGRYLLTEWDVGGASLAYCDRHLHQRNQIWINCNVPVKAEISFITIKSNLYLHSQQ